MLFQMGSFALWKIAAFLQVTMRAKRYVLTEDGKQRRSYSATRNREVPASIHGILFRCKSNDLYDYAHEADIGYKNSLSSSPVVVFHQPEHRLGSEAFRRLHDLRVVPMGVYRFEALHSLPPNAASQDHPCTVPNGTGSSP